MAAGVNMTDVYAPYRERLSQLIAERDAIAAAVAPLQKELTALNAEVEKAQLSAELKAKQISDIRGGQRYLNLKKEIAVLAKLLTSKQA